MAKITLTIRENGKSEQEQFHIESVTTGQMIKLKREFGAAMKDLKANGELKNFLSDLLGSMGDIDEDMEISEIFTQMKDQRFVSGLAGAFDKMLDVIPDRAFNILGIMSGIDSKTLENTPFEEIFDVYDAIMAENDVVKLVERAKKSFTGTKDQWATLAQRLFNGGAAARKIVQ